MNEQKKKELLSGLNYYEFLFSWDNRCNCKKKLLKKDKEFVR